VGNDYAERQREAQEALSLAEGLKGAGATSYQLPAGKTKQRAAAPNGCKGNRGIPGKGVTGVKSVKCKISLMIECSGTRTRKKEQEQEQFFCDALSQSQ